MIFFKFFNKFLSVALTAIISLSATAIPCNSGELPEYVYLGGEPFGLKMYSDGVMIVELESYFDGSKYVCVKRMVRRMEAWDKSQSVAAFRSSHTPNINASVPP